MFAFYYVILLRGFDIGALVYDAFLCIELRKGKFKAIVTVKYFYFGIKLGLNQGSKRVHTRFYVKFIFQHKSPCASREILNNGKKIMISIIRSSSTGSHKSKCTNSNREEEMCLVLGKDNLCCLASRQMRQGCGKVEKEDT